jgi:hypothetical protein
MAPAPDDTKLEKIKRERLKLETQNLTVEYFSLTLVPWRLIVEPFKLILELRRLNLEMSWSWILESNIWKLAILLEHCTGSFWSH